MSVAVISQFKGKKNKSRPVPAPTKSTLVLSFMANNSIDFFSRRLKYLGNYIVKRSIKGISPFVPCIVIQFHSTNIFQTIIPNYPIEF
jgi:hypothetical protein